MSKNGNYNLYVLFVLLIDGDCFFSGKICFFIKNIFDLLKIVVCLQKLI